MSANVQGGRSRKPNRLLRAGKWVVFVVASAAVLWPVALAIVAWRAEARLAGAVAEIASRGEPLMPADLVRPPIPAEENAASVYEKAFAAIELSEEDEELLSDLRRGESSLDDPEMGARARDIAKRNEEALRLIHRAADMPRCDFGIDWSKGHDVTFPHYPKLRTCARLLVFESLVLLDVGKVDEAAECGVTVFQLARAADDPSLIGQLVRYGIIATGWDALQLVLHDAEAEPSVCRRLAADIARIDLVHSLVQALKGDRALGRGLFAVLRSTRDPFEALEKTQRGEEMESSGAGEQDRPARKGRPRYHARWWLACDELEYLERMEVAIGEASRPYREALAAVEGLHRVPVTYVPPPAVVTVMQTPAFGRTFASRDQAIARLGMAEIALSLKAYKVERGEYPESLEELAVFVGQELPMDPFSEGPFVYRREGAGFLLYSLGANLEDDGGVAPERSVLREGDIVMRCVR